METAAENLPDLMTTAIYSPLQQRPGVSSLLGTAQPPHPGRSAQGFVPTAWCHSCVELAQTEDGRLEQDHSCTSALSVFLQSWR